MTSASLNFAVGFEGSATGPTWNPDLTDTISRQVVLTALTGSGKQIYETFRTALTVAAGATTTLDLTTGLTNTLGESISGSSKFVHVYAVLVVHNSASAASTVTVFNAAANAFQGPKGAGDADTLGPGMWTGFGVPANLTAWAVDGTHKNLAIVNNDGANAATVNVLVIGSTS